MAGSIAIVDYGMGNLRSVAKAIEHVAPLGTQVLITDHAQEILNADRVVFPGQGAAGDCMAALKSRELIEPLAQAAKTRPFLGICMGMQVMLDHSEENGGVHLLGWFKGAVRRFPAGCDARGLALKIPQMGWNQIQQIKPHPLWQGVADFSRFYFVHSYYCAPEDAALDVGVTEYGITYTSALAQGSVFAIQSHPEKSADDGLQVLKNFTRWDGRPD
ncbi:MAG: imidazole glycerol phosphate synthase subunit HisH [Halothiobacillus sp. 24-54-40]|jgi:glutamine amidotransferase|nr:MAG: imidazole glycerol phosphate synthase subunit HisH [Halothiobacillus sp. 35-54-62]OYZ86916.1 MAG: imidazole glycerol phosphate synthase subunit HisH [Halothiobacillus sp. 24-54-40]OZA80301.1 MAG: imidazole glycerol phosphate synthase subunit HisH [Halothiobacillus sp. 39-53-45]HQS02321.1 imidazole glycerol phosphate synthase subunit HisH [Halothiobacillus sp.]HQS02935.1 imidazole glycerol phosphate synthase subunit HisH [Halothiobacillus sp.]